MITVQHPFNKIEEVTKIAMRYTKFPEYIIKWRVFSTADGKKGVKSYNLVYVEDANIAEAEIYMVKLQQEFTQIDGYVYKVESLLSMSDYQKVLALKL